jgi:hypothetical protein
MPRNEYCIHNWTRDDQQTFQCTRCGKYRSADRIND